MEDWTVLIVVLQWLVFLLWILEWLLELVQCLVAYTVWLLELLAEQRKLPLLLANNPSSRHLCRSLCHHLCRAIEPILFLFEHFLIYFQIYYWPKFFQYLLKYSRRNLLQPKKKNIGKTRLFQYWKILIFLNCFNSSCNKHTIFIISEVRKVYFEIIQSCPAYMSNTSKVKEQFKRNNNKKYE